MTAAEREAWLLERRSGIGSSDAASLCLPAGSRGTFGTPLEVYASKLGLLPERDDQRMKWGRLLEDVVAHAFSEETGYAFVPPEKALYRHPMLPHLLASPDRRVPAWLAVLECKTSESRDGWGPSGSDLVPEGYFLQVQHQMEVLGIDLAFIAVLLPGKDFRWYRLERDSAVIAKMLAIYHDFWSLVTLATPPPPDWSHPETPRLLDLVYRPVEKTIASLDSLACLVADDYEGLAREIRSLEKRKERARAELVLALGNACEGHLPDGRVVKRTTFPVKASHRPATTQTRLTITGTRYN